MTARTTYALIEVDTSGQIVRCSDGLVRLFGEGDDQGVSIRLGMTIQEFGDALARWTTGLFVESMIDDVHGSDDERSREVVLANGAILECTYIRQPQHNLWIFRDVTNDRIEQDRLRFQSEVLSRVSDAVITVDASMAINYWN